MTKIESGKDYVEEWEALQQSPEWSLYQDRLALQLSFELHVANFQELDKLLQVVGHPKVALGLISQSRQEELEVLLKEAIRLLHNFAASAKTLVDHTRNHTGRLHRGTPFEAEYQGKVEALASSPVQRFIQDLRNFAQHYRIPLVGAEVRWEAEADKVDGAFRLEVERLLEWDGWHALSRKYIATHDEWIRIEEPIREYMQIITEFYEWLDRRELEIFDEELGRLEDRHDALVTFSQKAKEGVLEQIKIERAETVEDS